MARFPKAARLRKRREFLAVQQGGRKFSADCVLGLVRRGPPGPARLGVTVSSTVGNAVVRNRVKRRLRELFRARADTLPKGIELVVIARQSAAEADFERLRRAFDRLANELSRAFPA